jgi:hypothetical protein
MNARQVQVRGCLPTLLVLLVVGAVVAAVVTTSALFLAVAALAAVAAGVIRWVRGLLGGPETKTSAARRAADVTIDAEVVEPSEGGGNHPPRLE